MQPARGQQAAGGTRAAEESSGILRIGYLRREATGHPGENLLENMRRRLMEDGEVIEALRQAGYTGDNPIGLFACDGAEDMVRRLNAREFDLAFTPASIYARHQSNYRVVMKARRPGDSFSPGGVVRRFGVVIVSPRSPLFDLDMITEEALQEELERRRLAVVSTQSVAGFHAPLLELSQRLGLRRMPGSYLWFEDSTEVVKGVLSGLADIGVCEQGAIDQVLTEAGLIDPGWPEERRLAERSRYIREVLRTSPVITDPVLFAPSLAARQSDLGRLLRARLRDYSLEGEFGAIQYLASDDSEYRGLVELLRQFDRSVGEVPR